MAYRIDDVNHISPPSKLDSDLEFLESNEGVKQHSVEPHGLAELFDKDTMEKTLKEIFKQSASLQTPDTLADHSAKETIKTEEITDVPASINKPPSFFENVLSMFKKAEPAVIPPNDPLLPISSVPLLDDPEISTSAIPAAIPPLNTPKSTKSNEIIKIREIEEILSELSTKTIESIMAIIVKSAMELDKESVITADGTLQKYNEFKKIKNEVMEKIKDEILKDEIWASRVAKVGTITALTSMLCAAAAAAVSFGLAAPVGGAVGAAIGSGIGLLASAAPYTAATCVGVKSYDAYMKWHLDNEKAQSTLAAHQDTYYDRRANEGLDRLEKMGESDANLKELYGKFIKRSHDMAILVLQRSKKGEY